MCCLTLKIKNKEERYLIFKLNKLISICCKYLIMKKIIISLLLLTVGNVFGQRIQFEIKNDSIGNTFSLRTLTNKVLETVVIKEDHFKVDINFEEGYYFLKKEDHFVPLYLKPSDEFTISFDVNNFYNTLAFSGKNADLNTYLLNKKAGFVNEWGALNTYYKRSFYEGTEEDYLKKLDELYKGYYGILFSGTLDEDFVNEEMKNLQYGYYLDILKLEDAKKHYEFTDSIAISKSFLEPLSHLHYDNTLLYEKYPSYRKLSVLKWKKNIENLGDYVKMEDALNSIRTEPLKQRVLWSLYEEMSKDKPAITKTYFKLIKTNAERKDLITKAKEKYDEIKGEEAAKNLERFDYRNIHGEEVKLSEFKGNYIFISAWASWCKKCIKEFKKVQKLQEIFSEKPVVFVGVSLDKQEDFEKWRNVIKENSLENVGEQLFFKGDKSKFIQAYDVSGIPGYFILSLKGKKLEYSAGSISVKKIRKLLERELSTSN